MQDAFVQTADLPNPAFVCKRPGASHADSNERAKFLEPRSRLIMSYLLFFFLLSLACTMYDLQSMCIYNFAQAWITPLLKLLQDDDEVGCER